MNFDTHEYWRVFDAPFTPYISSNMVSSSIGVAFTAQPIYCILLYLDYCSYSL